MSDSDLSFLKKDEGKQQPSMSVTEELFHRVLNTLGVVEGRLKTLEEHVSFLLMHSPEYKKVLKAYEEARANEKTKEE